MTKMLNITVLGWQRQQDSNNTSIVFLKKNVGLKEQFMNGKIHFKVVCCSKDRCVLLQQTQRTCKILIQNKCLTINVCKKGNDDYKKIKEFRHKQNIIR
jgi:hypothetical protein